jgi:hypothetical protein
MQQHGAVDVRNYCSGSVFAPEPLRIELRPQLHFEIKAEERFVTNRGQQVDRSYLNSCTIMSVVMKWLRLEHKRPFLAFQ